MREKCALRAGFVQGLVMSSYHRSEQSRAFYRGSIPVIPSVTVFSLRNEQQSKCAIIAERFQRAQTVQLRSKCFSSVAFEYAACEYVFIT